MGWEKFVQDYRIPTRRGSAGVNIEIHCPFCGPNDHSKHMGLHMESTKFGCWKGGHAHSGRNPAILIQKLLNVDEQEALNISLAYFDISDYDFTRNTGRRHVFNSIVEPKIPEEFCSFSSTTEEFKALTQQQVLAQAEVGMYLVERGFDPIFATKRFNLKFAVGGDFEKRLIIPITWNRKILTWTSRSINDDYPRYKACKDSIYKPDMFLFDSDNLTGGKALLLCEGPLDAMKATSCLIAGVHATCLFGLNISDQQIMLLMAWSEMYEKVFVCLDSTELKAALKMVQQLSWYIPNVKILIPNRKDFGETPISELTEELQQKCL